MHDLYGLCDDYNPFEGERDFEEEKDEGEIIAKECMECRKMKPTYQFLRISNDKYGYDSVCEDCNLGPYRDDEYINSDIIPSKVTDSFWIRAYAKNSYPEQTDRGGKWLIFIEKGERLDHLWQKVRQTLYQGLLGRSAKTSTMRENSNARDKKAGVICVYTYSLDDLEDTRRVRHALRDIGVTWKIPYKLDGDIGKYSVLGDSKISKLYE